MESAGNAVTRHPCARNYPGRVAFSEPETRCLAEYVRTLRPGRGPGSRLKLYLSLHSSKQMILFPWGCTKERSADHDELVKGNRTKGRQPRLQRAAVQCELTSLLPSAGGWGVLPGLEDIQPDPT